MRTVTIVDQNDPRATHRYSAEPTDYALGVQYVLEATERIMRVRRLRPTGYYVPDAVDDRGETRHPSHFRAELFGLRGALYRASTGSMGHLDWRDFHNLKLHGPTVFYIAQHHLRVAATCQRRDMPWPTHTLRSGEGVTCHVISEFPLNDVEVEQQDDVLFEVLRTAGENLDATHRELEAIGEVSIPWPYRDEGWSLEDCEPTR